MFFVHVGNCLHVYLAQEGQKSELDLNPSPWQELITAEPTLQPKTKT